MSSSPNNDDAAAGGVENQHLPLNAPPSPLPPPPPPRPAPPSVASPPPAGPALALSSPYFPFNEPAISFFLDPFSLEAQDLKKTFEITSQAYGQTFPSTTDARLASHLVLDPSCDANQFIRRLAPEKVVSLRWLKDGFFKLAPPPEEEYRLGAVEEKQEEVEGVRDREQEEEEDEEDDGDAASSSFLHPPSDYVNPKYASRGGWLKSEEETFARFLASDPRPDENGRSIWDQYHLAHPSRTAQSYQNHYKYRKDAYFDPKVAELKGEEPVAPIPPNSRGGENARPGTDYVKGNATFAGWLVEEEEDLARFLASDPQKNEQGKIWQQYQRSHPSRTVHSYYEHHRKRREAYFDSKITELKEAANGQPIVYQHPEVEQAEAEEEERRELVETRRTQPISYREMDARTQPLPRRVDPDVVLLSGLCANCKVDRARKWHSLKGKGERRFCGACRAAHYQAERDHPGTGDDALARRRRRMLPNADSESSSEEEDSSDLAELDDSRPSQSSSQLTSSSSSRPAVGPKFVKSGVGSGHGCRDPWLKEEDDDLVRLLVRHKGRRSKKVWAEFCVKHPRRTVTAARKRYRLRKDVMDREIAAMQRREGKQSTRERAPMTESEELEDDDSMGDDEDSDDEEMDLRTPTSAPSSSSLFVDRKRPQESQQGSSSKRTRVDSPFNAAASSSRASSSSSHHHQPQSHHHSSSHNYASGPNYPLNQPRPSQPSFTQPVVASGSSFSSHQPHASSFQHASSSHPAKSAPPPPQADSSSDEDLEPPSFLELGARPTGCSPSSMWCFFCGCDKDGSDTFKEIPLAAKNLDTGEIQSIRARLACDVCQSTWEKRFVRKLKLGMGVAEMGELERLAWVTEVLIEKGREVRRERVYGREA